MFWNTAKNVWLKEERKMDITKKIEELVNKAKNDPDFLKKFQKDPVATVEGVVGVDLPNDQINQIVAGIKAKVTADKVGDMLGGILGKK